MKTAVLDKKCGKCSITLSRIENALNISEFFLPLYERLKNYATSKGNYSSYTVNGETTCVTYHVQAFPLIFVIEI
jgi:hypothetical protein